METSVIKKKLSKFSTPQLLVKVEKNSLSKEEMAVALEIIEKRTGSPLETAEEEMLTKGELDIEDTQEENPELTEGSITSEEVSEAIDKVYALENPEVSKGLMDLFTEPVDDYSDLSQEKRKEVIDYCNKVVAGVSPKDVKPEKKAKKSDKPEKKAKKSGENPFEFYGFNPNDYSEFKVDGKKFLLGAEGAEDVDVSKFSGIEAINLLGGKLKKGDKVTVTTAKGKVVSGSFCRIKFSSKPFVFSVYVTDETGEKVGFRLGSVKSIFFTE